MKILLVAMPNVIIGFDKSARFPNLGLNSLAGNVSGHEVKVVDLILSRGDIRNFVFEIISDYEPEVVGFTAMSFQYRTALELAKFIKGINSKIFTVLGGYHASLEYKIISKKDDSKYFDVLVRGEGEATFSELIDSISSGGDFSRIRGLSFKRNGEYVHNE
ncbi:MAG: B12-binding domain-containing radical SAM protein, partial [Fidelibacterota bacterium]